MHRSARDTIATRALLEHAEQRFTGRLTVGRRELHVSVHLLQGNLIAATSVDDLSQVVRVLALRGILQPDASDVLEERVEHGDGVLGELLETAGGPVLDGILRDRFIQNLSEFVSSVQKPEAVGQRAVFVENIQLGHDTRELVLATCDDYDAAMQVDPEMLVVRGDADPGRGPARALLVSKLGSQPRTVRSIIHEAPLEPLRARLVMAELLRSGVAEIVTQSDQRAPRSVSPAPAARTTTPPSARGMLAVADAQSAPLPLDAHTMFRMPADNVSEVLDPLPHEIEDDLSDEPTVTIPAVALRHVTQVDDEELSVFDDHDHSRGAGGAGAFSTMDHHRDVVEVTHPPPGPAPAPAVRPAESQPTVRFAGPSVGDDEVLNKVRVANGVLRAVMDAFDTAEGSGRGRAVLQLLVDGGPSRHSVLMRDLRVSERGELPEPRLLMNLRKRPTAEQHQLLHNSLVDIIERALSSAADELPDPDVDALLEAVAGYRHRMGR